MQSAPPTVGSTSPPVHRAAAERDRDRLGEPFAEDVHGARGAVDRGDLRVVPEPARLLIQPGQFGVDDGQHTGQVVRRPGRDPGAGAEGVTFRDCHHGRADVDHRPARRRAGPASPCPSVVPSVVVGLDSVGPGGHGDARAARRGHRSVQGSASARPGRRCAGHGGHRTRGRCGRGLVVREVAGGGRHTGDEGSGRPVGGPADRRTPPARARAAGRG